MERSLAEKFGEQETRKLISEGVYFISIGSNDYMGGYLGSPTAQQLYQPQEFIGTVIGNLTQAIQVSIFGSLNLQPLIQVPSHLLRKFDHLVTEIHN